jgi:hypothetical protein
VHPRTVDVGHPQLAGREQLLIQFGANAEGAAVLAEMWRMPRDLCR